MTDDLLSDWEDVGYPHVELVETTPQTKPEWEVCIYDSKHNASARVPVQPVLDGPKIVSKVVFHRLPPGLYDRYEVYYRGKPWRRHSMNPVHIAESEDKLKLTITSTLESNVS